MADITKENYAEWLEEALRHLFEYKPTSIAIVAVNDEDGTSAAKYFNCDAGMLAYLAGVIQQDGLFQRIENNREWLKELLEGSKNEISFNLNSSAVVRIDSKRQKNNRSPQNAAKA